MNAEQRPRALTGITPAVWAAILLTPGAAACVVLLVVAWLSR